MNGDILVKLSNPSLKKFRYTSHGSTLREPSSSASMAVYLSVDYYGGHKKKISTQVHWMLGKGTKVSSFLKQQKTTKVKQTSSVLMVSSTVTTTVALSTGEYSCLSSWIFHLAWLSSALDKVERTRFHASGPSRQQARCSGSAACVCPHTRAATVP